MLNMDLRGSKFGRLIVTGHLRDDRGDINYRCTCDCGNVIKVRRDNLLAERTKSCGCLKQEHEDARILARYARSLSGFAF